MCTYESWTEKCTIAFKNYSMANLSDPVTLVKQFFFGYKLLKGTLGIGNFVHFVYDLYIGREVATENEQKLLYFIEKQPVECLTELMETWLLYPSFLLIVGSRGLELKLYWGNRIT